MNDRTFSKTELLELNRSSKYGYNWISNLENVNGGPIRLYPTGDFKWTTGRIYIALPANKPLSNQDKVKYNII
jgi:hypothetical protein